MHNFSRTLVEYDVSCDRTIAAQFSNKQEIIIPARTTTDTTAAAECPPSRVLHLRNLPEECSEIDIRTVSCPFGLVKQVLFLSRKQQAFVEFSTVQEAALMLATSKSHPMRIGTKWTLCVQFGLCVCLFCSIRLGSWPSRRNQHLTLMPLEHVPLSAAVWLQQPVGDSHGFIAPSIVYLRGYAATCLVGMEKRGSTLTLLLLGEALS